MKINEIFRGRNAGMLVASLDQVASSAGNYVLIILLARSSNAFEFGILSVAFGVIAFGLTIGRSSLGAIASIDLPNLERLKVIDLLSRSTAAAVSGGAILATPMCVMAWLVGSGQLRGALLMLAITCPIVMVHDFWRFAAVSMGMPGVALVSDTLWLVTCLAGLSWDIFLVGTTVSVVFGAIVWAGGLVVSLLPFTISPVATRPRFKGLIAWLAGDTRRSHLTSDGTLAAAGPLLVAAGVSLLAGPQVTGAFRASGTLFGPLSMLFASIGLAAVPEAQRRSRRSARHLLRAGAVALAIFAVIWASILSAVPYSLGHSILGMSWDKARPLFWITAVEYAALAVWVCATSMLRVEGRTRTALNLRVIHSILSLVLANVCAASFGTAQLVAASLATSAIIVAVMGFRSALLKDVGENSGAASERAN
jgi:O-antigen/teichoic acid export membrane protein